MGRFSGCTDVWARGPVPVPVQGIEVRSPGRPALSAQAAISVSSAPQTQLALPANGNSRDAHMAEGHVVDGHLDDSPLGSPARPHRPADATSDRAAQAMVLGALKAVLAEMTTLTAEFRAQRRELQELIATLHDQER